VNRSKNKQLTVHGMVSVLSENDFLNHIVL